MRYFVFSGDPNRDGEGPHALTAYGLKFDRSTPTAVEDEAVAKKLCGNGHFTEVKPVAEESPSFVGTITSPEGPPSRRKAAAAE